MPHVGAARDLSIKPSKMSQQTLSLLEGFGMTRVATGGFLLGLSLSIAASTSGGAQPTPSVDPARCNDFRAAWEAVRSGVTPWAAQHQVRGPTQRLHGVQLHPSIGLRVQFQQARSGNPERDLGAPQIALGAVTQARERSCRAPGRNRGAMAEVTKDRLHRGETFVQRRPGTGWRLHG